MKAVFEITGVFQERKTDELAAISLNIWNESSKELTDFVRANFKKPVEVEIKEAANPGDKKFDIEMPSYAEAILPWPPEVTK
jgi:hypothetical protein